LPASRCHGAEPKRAVSSGRAEKNGGAFPAATKNKIRA
jgi:hypothetical protein